MLCIQNAGAQATNVLLRGKVVDERGQPLELVSVFVLELNAGTTTNAKGHFEMSLPASKVYNFRFQSLGYEPAEKSIRIKPGETPIPIEVALKTTVFSIQGVSVEDRMERNSNMVKIDPKISSSLANPSGNFEMILQGMGARSSQELSSQYSVRGGNFD